MNASSLSSRVSKEDDMAEEKFVEHADRSPVTHGVNMDDAAMTRRILLKLDFR